MSKKLTQKEVLDRFKKVHGDKYDYSLVDYLFEATKVNIICKKDGHGVFPQTPKDHFSGRGCPDCGKIKRTEKSKLTQKEVLERFKKVHGKTYDYSLVEYVGVDTDVEIICNKDGHGVFPQRPSKHFKGQGCPDCGKIKSNISRKLTQKEVLERFKKVHGDTYDYSLVKYNRSDENVIIICSVHGEFPQTPETHWTGSGCNECGNIKTGNSRRKTKEEFIDEARLVHGDEYDYTLVEYKDYDTKVKIECKKDGHGVFPMTPSNHLEGQGCPDCGRIKSSITRTKSTEIFVKQAQGIHADKNYDYHKVNYIKGEKEVVIVCPIHGDFPQTPKKHLQGHGCHFCFNKGEDRLAKILNGNVLFHRNYRINEKLFDFYLPDHNLIIERDGQQHYYDVFPDYSIEENHQNDIEKTNLAKSKGHKVCRIPYWLSEVDERKEIQNILKGQPTYPDVPDLEHEKSKPLPN